MMSVYQPVIGAFMGALWGMLAVVAAFFSAFLLFSIQPIIGKIFLPFLGGSPAVWNMCMVFFQGLLLVGYLYSHILNRKSSPRFHVSWHLIVYGLACIVLPIGLPVELVNSSLIAERPVYWLLFALTVTVGPCFFVLSAMSPLIQTWFHKCFPERNPYLLFSASNAGSLLALVLYPLLFEAVYPVSEQARLWSVGFAANGVLLALLAAKGFRSFARQSQKADGYSEDAFSVDRDFAQAPDENVNEEDFDLDAWQGLGTTHLARIKERGIWFFLAFIPSSLMLGVTNYLTTDVAAVPMFWVIPLALYLLTYIIAFGRFTERWDHRLASVLPLLVATLLFLIFSEYRQNLWLVMSLHCSLVFLISLAVHGRLALKRPLPQRLTEFYTVTAVGGVAGGLLNAWIAPNLLEVMAEYPVVAALSLGMLLSLPQEGRVRHLVGAGLCALLGALVLFLSGKAYDLSFIDWSESLSALSFFKDLVIEEAAVRVSLLYGIPLFVILCFYRWQIVTAAALIGFSLLGSSLEVDHNILTRSRSIYGTLTVKQYSNPEVHSLVHGGILHGEQRMDSPEERAQPRSYYHKDGPLGQVFEMVSSGRVHPQIAALGMGTGSIAAYGSQANSITFYELNPNVVELASNPKYFTYVDDCRRRWCDLKVVLGDARLNIMAAESTYDAIIVDAFSSDSIPVHLITRDAVLAYLEKLTEGGLLVFHISNRYVNLEPVLLHIAKSLELGYAIRSDDADDSIGKGASSWVVLASEEGLFDPLYADDRWRGLEEQDDVGVWTDDYAALLKVFTFF